MQYSNYDFIYGSGINQTTIDGLTHSFNLNIADGKTYTIYHRCMDSSGNKNDQSVFQLFLYHLTGKIILLMEAKMKIFWNKITGRRR